MTVAHQTLRKKGWLRICCLKLQTLYKLFSLHLLLWGPHLLFTYLQLAPPNLWTQYWKKFQDICNLSMIFFPDVNMRFEQFKIYFAAMLIKSSHSEKVTKIWNNPPLCFNTTEYLNSKQGGIYFLNFVAFSQYLNFIWPCHFLRFKLDISNSNSFRLSSLFLISFFFICLSL